MREGTRLLPTRFCSPLAHLLGTRRLFCTSALTLAGTWSCATSTHIRVTLSAMVSWRRWQKRGAPAVPQHSAETGAAPATRPRDTSAAAAAPDLAARQGTRCFYRCLTFLLRSQGRAPCTARAAPPALDPWQRSAFAATHFSPLGAFGHAPLQETREFLNFVSTLSNQGKKNPQRSAWVASLGNRSVQVCTSINISERSLLDSTNMAAAALQMPRTLEGSQAAVSQRRSSRARAVLSRDPSSRHRRLVVEERGHHSQVEAIPPSVV